MDLVVNNLVLKPYALVFAFLYMGTCFVCLICFVALPPSNAARSQVDQERGDTVTKNEITKLTTVQHLNVQRMFIHPLQPSCDAQEAATC